MQNKSICAVVVTHNRKSLLFQCLNAIKQQTHKVSCIIIINNASIDGTEEALLNQNWNDNLSFQLLTLPENEGGAGGFYQGIKSAYEQGFDYIWLMDDDGYPHKDCLANLIPYLTDNAYIGPIVIDSKTKDKLSFAARIPNGLKVFDSYSQISNELKGENIIKDLILPFNGTLISRDLINKIGFPYKEYFIWGDEKEYSLRAKSHKADIFTVVNAIFYHPADSSLSTPMFFNKLRFNNTQSDLKLYCFCRNSISIYLKHYNIFYVLLFFIKTSWFFIFTKPSMSKLKLVYRAMWHGLKRDFTHHKEYLK